MQLSNNTYLKIPYVCTINIAKPINVNLILYNYPDLRTHFACDKTKNKNTASSIQNSMLFKVFLYFIWERPYCNYCDYFFYLWLFLFEITKYPVKY